VLHLTLYQRSLSSAWLRKEKKRKEKKRTEKTVPFSVNSMRSQVLYRAVQNQLGLYVSKESPLDHYVLL
jgi:hypothetical protein